MVWCSRRHLIFGFAGVVIGVLLSSWFSEASPNQNGLHLPPEGIVLVVKEERFAKAKSNLVRSSKVNLIKLREVVKVQSSCRLLKTAARVQFTDSQMLLTLDKADYGVAKEILALNPAARQKIAVIDDKVARSLRTCHLHRGVIYAQ